MANKNYESITLYKDMGPQVLAIELEEAGAIYQAIMRYTLYGEDTDFSNYDRFIRSLWETTKMKLLAGEKHREHISETNRNNINKRWGKDTTVYDGTTSDTTVYDGTTSDTTVYDGTTDTDTVTRTNTPTISSTVTKTETRGSVSADCGSASAAAVAEPSHNDLFSVKQLMAIAKKNKVDLTDEGLGVFHEEMSGSDWMLYQKPVEKKGITRALRAWAKYHPEYTQELEEIKPVQQPELEKQEPEPEFDSNNPEMIKEWLVEKFGGLKIAKEWVLENFGASAFEEMGIKEEEFL